VRCAASETFSGGSPVHIATRVRGSGRGPSSDDRTGGFSNFYYGQAIVSKKLDWFEPFAAYRFQFIDLDLNLNDPDDKKDIFDSILEEIVKEANKTDLRLHHFFLGARLDLGSGFYLIPEVSYIAGDASGLGSAGAAIGYQWQW